MSRAESVQCHIVEKIRTHNLQPGDRLPTVRQLAMDCHVTTPTVREALRALETAGVVELRHGSGTYVHPNAFRLVVANPVAIPPLNNVRTYSKPGSYSSLPSQLKPLKIEHVTTYRNSMSVRNELSSTIYRPTTSVSMYSLHRQQEIPSSLTLSMAFWPTTFTYTEPADKASQTDTQTTISIKK